MDGSSVVVGCTSVPVTDGTVVSGIAVEVDITGVEVGCSGVDVGCTGVEVGWTWVDVTCTSGVLLTIACVVVNN